MQGGGRRTRGPARVAAAVLFALLLAAASVHADAATAPARRLLGAADGGAVPVSVSKATSVPHCGTTGDPTTSCPPPSHAP
ncbi:hypothetical protein BDA96_02G205600 [Sorghum bicolor]|uniref:Uncharacterized protein n=2 Tax=Sorghum bicolor TaxID=4558 RepID=A0A921RP33_SORBI|nr:hypothetical protein BDA96_02G205600 [Sorghum bicolor]OQU89464.1 hypothetical protein SORBI_3002G195066 [Sorghum bicolor]